jgi:hypothetical protein
MNKAGNETALFIQAYRVYCVSVDVFIRIYEFQYTAQRRELMGDYLWVLFTVDGDEYFSWLVIR